MALVSNGEQNNIIGLVDCYIRPIQFISGVDRVDLYTCL